MAAHSPPSTVIRWRTLGESVVEIGESRFGPEAEVMFAMMLYLSAHAGRSLDRGPFLELFWPDAGEYSARHCLRQIVYKLRRMGAPLEVHANRLQLDARSVVADFVSIEADGAAHASLAMPSAFGPFLPGYAPAFSARFAEWVEALRDRVHARLRRIVLQQLASSRAAGDYVAVERLARACLSYDPLNDEATLSLAEAAAVQGSKREAVALLDRYLTEVGSEAADLRVPASILRRRIAERLPEPPYTAARDAPFVGREQQMAELARMFQTVRAGQGAACLIVGEPGIGKTRLVTEFTKVAVVQGARLERVLCQSADLRRPLSIFVDLVPQLLNLPGAIGCAPRSLTYLKRLTEHDATMTTPSEDSRESEHLYACVREAVLDLFSAITAEACLVVHVEDVHWLDTLSRRLLAELLARSAHRRLLLLLTARPVTDESPDALERIPGVRLVRVPPLDAESGAVLLAALTAGRHVPLTDAQRDWCLRVADGNPFFLQELTAHPDAADGGERLPPSLRTLIDERLARLTPDGLHVLQACATLGKHATSDRVEAVLELTRFALQRAVHELDGQGLLASDGPHLLCKHDLLAESAQARLAPAARKLLHRHAALALEAEITASQSASLLWDCARHWELAGDPAHALRLARRCGQHLLEVGLPRDAAEVFEKAMEYCRGTDDQLDLLQAEALARRLAGNWEAVIKATQRRLALVRKHQINVPTNADECLLIEANVRIDPNPPHLLADVIDRLCDVTVDPRQRVRLALWALIIADNECDCVTGDIVHRSVESVAGATFVDEADRAEYDVVYHSSFGDLDIAAHAARYLVERRRRDASHTLLCRALRFAANPLHRLGLFTEARAYLEEAYQIAERAHVLPDTFAATECLTYLEFEAGEVNAARFWASRALALSDYAILARESAYVIAARVALLDGDAVALHARLAAVSQSLPRALRGKCHVVALTAREALLRRESVHPQVVADLEKLHARVRAGGFQDFNSLALYEALVSQDQHAHAAHLLSIYLRTYRRDRFPPSRGLVALSRILGAADASDRYPGSSG